MAMSSKIGKEESVTAKMIKIFIPVQTFEIEIDEDDYEEWVRDPDFMDSLYDQYIHHYLQDIESRISIWNGEEKVFG